MGESGTEDPVSVALTTIPCDYFGGGHYRPTASYASRTSNASSISLTSL